MTENHPAKVCMHVVVLGIIVNILLAGIKLIGGFLGNSYALIADGIESFSDVFVSLAVFFGLKVAAKPADENHPYGHGKAEPLASLVVSFALAIAGIVIVVQSVREIFNPGEIPAFFTLYILGLVVVVKEILFRYFIETSEEKNSIALKTDAWHHRVDSLTSIAAFFGIGIAIVFGIPSADDYAALIASSVIFWNAYQLFLPALKELMDEAFYHDVEDEVAEIALTVAGVQALDKCYVRKMGFDFCVDLQIVVKSSISVKKGHDIAHDVKDLLQSVNPRLVSITVHVEPYDKNREYWVKK